MNNLTNRLKELERKLEQSEEENQTLEDRSYDLTTRILNALEFDDIQRLCDKREMSMEEVYESIRNGDITLDEILDLTSTPSASEILSSEPNILSDRIEEVEAIVRDEGLTFNEAGWRFLELEGERRLKKRRAEEAETEKIKLEKERRVEEARRVERNRPLLKYLDDLEVTTDDESEAEKIQAIKKLL